MCMYKTLLAMYRIDKNLCHYDLYFSVNTHTHTHKLIHSYMSEVKYQSGKILMKGDTGIRHVSF